MSITISAPIAGAKKKRRRWFTNNKKVVHRWVNEAKLLLTSQEKNHITSALNLVNDALTHSPKLDSALELKAKSLLFLRRFNEVAAMLHDYIPSLKLPNIHAQDSPLIHNSSTNLLRDKSKNPTTFFNCFSFTGIKKKVKSGMWKWRLKRNKTDNQGQWRYAVLGQACYHLGLLEDAQVLLQTAKRLAADASRRRSFCCSEDSFPYKEFPLCRDVRSAVTDNIRQMNRRKMHVASPPPKSENDAISQLLTRINTLLRSKTAAIAAFDSEHYSEAIKHFSKILNSRNATPRGFLAQCYMFRGSAYWSAGRIADAIADCNKTLALDSSCVLALNSRARIFEEIGCITDSLHDLEHLKLLYNSILRDKSLQGPAWKRSSLQYREIPGKLCSLATKIESLKKKVASGEKQNVDYYALIGIRRGCSRSELNSAVSPLTLRHNPEKALTFIDMCEFADNENINFVRERAKSSATMLYKMILKGHTCVLNTIAMDENGEEKQRTIFQPRIRFQQQAKVSDYNSTVKAAEEAAAAAGAKVENKGIDSKAIQGPWCRDVNVVGNLVSRVKYNGSNAVKYKRDVEGVGSSVSGVRYNGCSNEVKYKA